MIVKDAAAHVGRCLDSALPHVSELAIVDTGSSDDTEAEVARAVARHGTRLRLGRFLPEDHPSSFVVDEADAFGPDLGPYTGRPMLVDFSAARRASLALATGEHVLWLDADDELVAGEALPIVAQRMLASGSDAAFLDYDYGRDASGRVSCRLSRERLILRSSSQAWTGPVHEILGPALRPSYHEWPKISHRRAEWNAPSPVAHRNLKILIRATAGLPTTSIDPRLLYYLGREEAPLSPSLAVEHLREACRRSEWPEERASARTMLASLLEASGDLQAARAELAEAALDAPSQPEPLLGLARLALASGDLGSCERRAAASLAVARSASTSPPSGVPCDPSSWHDAHALRARALLALGRPEDALLACSEGLASRPDDRELASLSAAASAARRAAEPAARTAKISASISGDEPLSSPPAGLPARAQTLMAIELWRGHMAAGRPEAAIALLDALPPEAVDAGKIASARRHAEQALARSLTASGTPRP